MNTRFFKEAWAELKKVQTPSKDETIRSAIGVFAMILVFGLFLGVTDFLVGKFVRTILGME